MNQLQLQQCIPPAVVNQPVQVVCRSTCFQYVPKPTVKAPVHETEQISACIASARLCRCYNHLRLRVVTRRSTSPTSFALLSPQLIPAFDFGTSPHGLSAYLNETFRKPPCGISPFSAKQGFTERNISFAIFQLASTINNY